MKLFKKIKRAIIVPDSHVPFENHRSFKLLHKVIEYVNDKYGVDELVLLGDFADASCLSLHGTGKHPNLPSLLIREVECVNIRLDQFDKLLGSDIKKVFIEGNHCYRLDRYLRLKCPELFGFIDIPGLFRLRDRSNWHFIPYTANQKYKILNSHLYARHTPIGPNAKSTAQKAMSNIIYGHVHTVEEAQVKSLKGEVFRAISSGCLVDTSSPTFDYLKNHDQWSQAFSICHVLKDGTFFNQLIHIINNQCFYDGKLFKV